MISKCTKFILPSTTGQSVQIINGAKMLVSEDKTFIYRTVNSSDVDISFVLSCKRSDAITTAMLG